MQTETLRKYPPVPVLNRKCSHEYKIPGMDKVIEEGIQTFIPVYGLHHDPQFYPEPEKFIPERFNEENKTTARPYYPFGDGPRNCIGLRLGLVQTKLNIASMLRNYRYELAEAEKNRKMTYSKKTILTTPANGILFNVYKR